MHCDAWLHYTPLLWAIYKWCSLWPSCELFTYFFNYTSWHQPEHFSRCKLLHAPFLSISLPCTFSLYQLISFPLSSPVWGLDMSPHLWIPAALLWRLSDGRTARFCITHKTQQNLPFLLCLEKTASCSPARILHTQQAAVCPQHVNAIFSFLPDFSAEVFEKQSKIWVWNACILHNTLNWQWKFSALQNLVTDYHCYNKTQHVAW